MVKCQRLSDAVFELRYTLEGEFAHLTIRDPTSPRRADRLWQHTCFEAFVAADQGAAYYEFNFAPSTEWAIYRFSAYREGMTAVEAAAPRITVRRSADRLDLGVLIDLEQLPALRDSSNLRLALAAVIEDADGRVSYWAIVHPADKPDFHHPDNFTLALPPPTTVAPPESLPPPQPSPWEGEG